MVHAQNYLFFSFITLLTIVLVVLMSSDELLLGGQYILPTIIFLPSLATISKKVVSTIFSLKNSKSFQHLYVMPLHMSMAVPPPLLFCL